MKKFLLATIVALVSICSNAGNIKLISGNYKDIPKGAMIDVYFDYSNADGTWEVDAEILESMLNPDAPKCNDLEKAEVDFIEEFNDECSSRKVFIPKKDSPRKYKMIVTFSHIKVGGVMGKGDMQGTIEVFDNTTDKSVLKLAFNGIKVASHSWARTSKYMNLKSGYEHLAEDLADKF